MSGRKSERRVNLIVGIFVLVFGSLGFVSIFIIATSEGLLEPKTEVSADFRTISGLAKNSPVQLSGMKIGTVKEINFTTPQYPCAPLTEDFGRDGAGRTDDCEQSLFCAAEALCAEVEDYSGSEDNYEPCEADGTCPSGEVCITKEFRRRYRRVVWAGPEGKCVPYFTEHRRVSVTMEVYEDKLVHIRQDSRATISSNGVLGDQLVSITVGQGDPMPPGGKIQTMPSIMEEIMFFKDRLDSITDNIDSSLAGVSGLFDSLNDDRTKRDLKGIIANTNEITRQVAEGEGLVGALFSDEQYREDFGATLRSVRNTASNVDGAVATVNRELGPAMRNFSKASKSIGGLVDDVRDPENQALVAKLVHDQEMGEDVKQTVKDFSEAASAAKGAITDAEVRHSISTAEGTLGKLLKDPKAYDDLVKVLGNIERNNVIKKMVRFVVEQDEASSSAAPTVAPDLGAASDSAPE